MTNQDMAGDFINSIIEEIKIDIDKLFENTYTDRWNTLYHLSERVSMLENYLHIIGSTNALPNQINLEEMPVQGDQLKQENQLWHGQQPWQDVQTKQERQLWQVEQPWQDVQTEQERQLWHGERPWHELQIEQGEELDQEKILEQAGILEQTELFMQEDNTLITLTEEELSNFNGKNGKPAYVAVNDTVYDVTNIGVWAAASHFGLHAGKNLTKDYMTCHAGTNAISKLPIVGKLI